MTKIGRPKKSTSNWDSINGKLDRYVTIRTNNYYDKLLIALQRRMKVSQGEIFRQGLQLLSVQWRIDPFEEGIMEDTGEEEMKDWWVKSNES